MHGQRQPQVERSSRREMADERLHGCQPTAAAEPAPSGLPETNELLIIMHMLSVKISAKHQIAVPSEAR
jgi:hypothetical protein